MKSLSESHQTINPIDLFAMHNEDEGLVDLVALLSAGEKDIHADQQIQVIEHWVEKAEDPAKVANSATGATLSLDEFKRYQDCAHWAGIGIIFNSNPCR